MREVRDAMVEAGEGRSGEEALDAMGAAYIRMLEADPRRLMLQMHMYAACDEPEIRDVAREGYGELVAFAERLSGVSQAEITRFFARGMLINVIAAMGLRGAGIDWADRLISGCKDEV
jgi:hypothetical protein